MTSDEIADQIQRIVINNADDPTAALEALADSFAFVLSLLTCPDCRKQAARALEQAIPGMLAHANRVAAEYASVREPALPHTHH